MEIKWCINSFSDIESSRVKIHVDISDMSIEEHVYWAIGRCSRVASFFSPRLKFHQLMLEFSHSWEEHGQLGTEDLAVVMPVFYL